MASQTVHSQLLSLVHGDSRPELSTLIFSSIILGIFASKAVYNFMKVVSPLCLPYTRLSKSNKIEWDNRGISTLHAIAVSLASSYFLFLSDLFNDDAPYGPLVFRTSVFLQVIGGISVGYFISDLAMILWFYPKLGGKEYVVHHLLSMGSVVLSVFKGEGSFYVYLVLFSEITTPFVNLRWYLSCAGMKQTTAYVINGIFLFFAWMIARVLLFGYLMIHLFEHFDQVRQMSKPTYYCIIFVPPCLAAMNTVWFVKLAKGLLKILSKTE